MPEAGGDDRRVEPTGQQQDTLARAGGVGGDGIANRLLQLRCGCLKIACRRVGGHIVPWRPEGLYRHLAEGQATAGDEFHERRETSAWSADPAGDQMLSESIPIRPKRLSTGFTQQQRIGCDERASVRPKIVAGKIAHRRTLHQNIAPVAIKRDVCAPIMPGERVAEGCGAVAVAGRPGRHRSSLAAADDLSNDQTLAIAGLNEGRACGHDNCPGSIDKGPAVLAR